MTHRSPARIRAAMWVVGTLAVAVSGCAGSGPTTQTPAATAETSVPAPTSVSTDKGGVTTSSDLLSMPSTTTPDPLTALDCTEAPLQIVETVFLQRQRQIPTPNCVTGLSDLIANIPDSPPCWTECSDGTVFVAFELNPVVVDLEILDQDILEYDSGKGVLYTATYLLPDGELIETAESISLIQTDDDHLDAYSIGRNDLSAQRATAESALATYFDALEAGDYDTAANLLIGASSVGWEERSDLSRLLQDGLAEEQTSAALAAALNAWCLQGALCRSPDRIEYDITPQHGIRGIAQYNLESGVVESEFFGGSFEGTTEVRGLPPFP